MPGKKKKCERMCQIISRRIKDRRLYGRIARPDEFCCRHTWFAKTVAAEMCPKCGESRLVKS